MTHDADLDELDLVRAFRAPLAEPPPGLQARIEERLWQDVLAEEARVRGGGRSARRRDPWWRSVFAPSPVRQLAVAGVAALAIFGFSVADGQLGSTSSAISTQAGSGSTSDPIAAAMRAIGGGTDVGSAGEIRTSLEDGHTAPLVAGTTMVVFENGEEVPLAQVAAGPAAMTRDQLALLPADERLLIGLLRAAGGTSSGHDADFEPFRLGALYLSDPRVPVTVRIALMRMLRVIDGIDAGGSSVDVFGRPGVVVARHDATSGLRQQYLLDESTGRLLEHREYVHAQRLAECPAGTVVAVGAYDSTGFTVTREQQPYGSWPETRPECDPGA